MNHLSSTLYNKQQIRQLEDIAINELKIPAYTLMQRAGNAAYSCLREYWTESKNIAVMCGPGNNGGDGYIVAYLAKQQNKQVIVYAVGDHSKLSDVALKAQQECVHSNVTIVPWSPQTVIINCDVIVDAILGIGLHDTVKSPFQEAIEAINASRLPVLAIDVPSGLDVDTGRVLGTAVEADVTATFIGLKQGMFTGEAPDYCGKIHCYDLEIPEIAYQKVPKSAELTHYNAQSFLLPPRKRTANKGSYGHVLIVGGDYGYAGSVRMAAEAAGRTGAGLVSVATRPEHIGIITSMRPEVMARAVAKPSDLDQLLSKANVVAIGPGLGQSSWGKELLDKVINTSLPLIVDADGLNLLAHQSKQRSNWILTPHPGEAARLLHCDKEVIAADRFLAAKMLQQQYGGVIVLKGAGTIVIDATNNYSVCSEGNPGMATGGMGDVLTGVLAGLLAQCSELAEIARLGVTIHAKAGDLARENGERGMLALDLMPYIRKLVNP